MMFEKLLGDVFSRLERDLNDLASRHRGFPFHIGVSKHYDSKAWMVTWSLDKHAHNPAAQVDVYGVGCDGGSIFCTIRACRKKLHDGETERKSVFDSGYDYYKQDWRFEPYCGPMDARVIWLMLETTCDWEKARAAIAGQVLES